MRKWRPGKVSGVQGQCNWSSRIGQLMPWCLAHGVFRKVDPDLLRYQPPILLRVTFKNHSLVYFHPSLSKRDLEFCWRASKGPGQGLLKVAWPLAFSQGRNEDASAPSSLLFVHLNNEYLCLFILINLPFAIKCLSASQVTNSSKIPWNFASCCCSLNPHFPGSRLFSLNIADTPVSHQSKCGCLLPEMLHPTLDPGLLSRLLWASPGWATPVSWPRQPHPCAHPALGPGRCTATLAPLHCSSVEFSSSCLISAQLFLMQPG